MDSYHAAFWSDPYSSSDEEEKIRYRNTNHKRTKQRGFGQQQRRKHKTPGLERRFWTARDPGHKQGNIAALKYSLRQRKRRGAGMRLYWGAHGECG
jgi:hypothetical protein